MPTTTLSRRVRKYGGTFDIRTDDNPLPVPIWDWYMQRPMSALHLCWGRFGRQTFENVLRHYLRDNTLKTSFRLAVKYLIYQEKNNGNTPKANL